MCENCKKVVSLILPHLFLAGAQSLAGEAMENLTIADIEAQQNTADSTKLLGEMTKVLNARHAYEDTDRLLEAIYVEEGRDTLTLTRAAKIAYFVGELSQSLARLLLMAIEEKAHTGDTDAVEFALNDIGHAIRDSVPAEHYSIGEGHTVIIGVGAASNGEEEPAAPDYRH